jgi:hypothetical protein
MLMRGGLIFVLLVLGTAAWAGDKPEVVPLQRSLSSSQQFIIYFSDGAVRGRLARLTEDLKREWLQVLGLKDDWKAPIIVQVVTTRQASALPMTTSVYLSDGGELKIQIDIYGPSLLKGPDLPMEVYRALCLEYMYRKAPPKAGKAITLPPAWLIEGIYEDTVTREEGLPAGLFEMLIKSGPPPKLEAFLKMRPERLDASSRAVYRAQAMGLLRALLRVPGGAKSLAAYLSGLPGGNPNDAGRLLEKFPQFASTPAELSKVWTLSLANASASDRVKPLGMMETSRQLALLLDMSAMKDPKKPAAGLVMGPDALQAMAKGQAGPYLLGQKAEDLLRLELRAHPVMRPIVGEYRLIATELAEKPRRNLEKRIHKNMELQTAVEDRIRKVEDYLNWFEATQLNTPSREFESIPAGPNSVLPPKRADAISRTLDGYEAQGW